MAIGDSYCSATEYRTFKGKRSDANDDILTICLEAMSRVLDLKLNQPVGFNKDATGSPSTRVYGPGDQIAPIASTTGLVVKVTGETSAIDWSGISALTINTDYELLPRNLESGWPYTDISLLTYGVWYWARPFDPRTYRSSAYRYQVTAIHGWPEVPAAIKWATVELVAMLGGESIFTSGQIQQLDTAVDVSPQARSLLNDLTRVYNRYPVMVA